MTATVTRTLCFPSSASRRRRPGGWHLGAAALLTLSLLLTLPALAAQERTAGQRRKPEPTRFALDLSERLDVQAVVLARPDRVVIEAPGATWPATVLPIDGRGLIRTIRREDTGGRLRLVLDTAGPVRIARTGYEAPQPGFAARWVIELVPGEPGAAAPPAAAPVRSPAPPRADVLQASGRQPEHQPAALTLTLDPERLAARVLDRNFDVRAARESTASAAAAVVEADAAFDPTLFTSLSYTKRYTRGRTDLIGRLRDVDVNTLNEDEQRRAEQSAAELEDPTSVDAQRNLYCTSVTIDGVTYPPVDSRCFLPPVYSLEQEYAVGTSRSTNTVIGSLGAALQFPFGGSANLALSSTWRRKYATSGAPLLTDPAYPTDDDLDPYGFGETLFWTSKASAALSMPLPYTKGFGRTGATPAYTLAAARSAERRAALGDRAARNAALADALTTWWDLVRLTEEARVLAAHRGLVAERALRIRRLFDAGEATQYDLAQVDASLASLENQEEIARNSYAVAANTLKLLTGAERGVTLRPVEAEEALRRPIDAPGGPDIEALEQTSPELKIRREEHDLSKLSLAYRENQDRLDLSFYAQADVGQTDSAFGYENLGISLGRLARPDTANVYFGLRLRLPLGGNQTGAAFDRARIEERQAFDRVAETRLKLATQLGRAFGAVTSAGTLVRQRAQDVELAGFAYDRAAAQRDEGIMTEFEVLNRLSDLLTARLSLLTARIDERKALVRLRAVQGTLDAEADP